MTLNGVDIKNNIFYKNAHYALDSCDAHGSDVAVDHNLCFGNGYGQYDFARQGSDYSYSLGTTLSTDPHFMNGSSANFDAHFRRTIPAMQAGLNLYSVFTTDKDGATRPAVGPWNLGAYIYAP